MVTVSKVDAFLEETEHQPEISGSGAIQEINVF